MGKRLGALMAVAALSLAGCAPSPTTPDPTSSPTGPVPSASPSSSAPTEPSTPAPVVPAPPLDAAELSSFGGVATLSISASCTGTLIDTGVDAGPAYLLTNGHCIGLDGRDANETLVDDEGQGEARFFNVKGGADDELTVAVERLEYGTMREVDVAVVRLAVTLGELRGKGAVPLPIVDASPQPGTPVVNVAAPVQAIEPEDQVLRKGECTIGEAVDLIEHKWVWFDAPRHDCPGVLGGSSGSPLIADGTIVSIVNTTNTGVPADRGDTCYLGKPCEIDGDAVTFVPDTSYGVDIAGVGACFVDGRFTLGGSCPLPQATLGGLIGGGIFGADGTDSGDRTADVLLTSEGPSEILVTQKVSPGDARSCTDPATYASAEPLTRTEGDEDATLPVTLPSEEGFTLVCAAERGKETQAARFVYSVDTTAPTEGPKLSITPLGDAEVMVDPLFDIPDIADLHLLVGPVDETDCSDRDAYFPYRRQPLFFGEEDLPARFCAVGFDMAGNESPITDQIIELP